MNALSTAAIEAVRGFLVILGHEREVGKGAQVIAQSGELDGIPNTGQELLPDKSQEQGSARPDKIPKLGNGWLGKVGAAP